MHEVGSHVLAHHVRRIAEHHHAAHHAAHADHQRHATPPPAPEGGQADTAPQRPNLGGTGEVPS